MCRLAASSPQKYCIDQATAPQGLGVTLGFASTLNITGIRRTIPYLISLAAGICKYDNRIRLICAKTQLKLTDLDCPFWLAPMPLYVSWLRVRRSGSTSAQP
jgi:hypothetical protein